MCCQFICICLFLFCFQFEVFLFVFAAKRQRGHNTRKHTHTHWHGWLACYDTTYCYWNDALTITYLQASKQASNIRFSSTTTTKTTKSKKRCSHVCACFGVRAHAGVVCVFRWSCWRRCRRRSNERPRPWSSSFFVLIRAKRRVPSIDVNVCGQCLI